MSPETTGNRLIDFYWGHTPDYAGRTIETIWQLSRFWLEHTHDYIQWLFPLPEHTRFNSFAPLAGVRRSKFRAK